MRGSVGSEHGVRVRRDGVVHAHRPASRRRVFLEERERERRGRAADDGDGAPAARHRAASRVRIRGDDVLFESNHVEPRGRLRGREEHPRAAVPIIVVHAITRERARLEGGRRAVVEVHRPAFLLGDVADEFAPAEGRRAAAHVRRAALADVRVVRVRGTRRAAPRLVTNETTPVEETPRAVAEKRHSAAAAVRGGGGGGPGGRGGPGGSERDCVAKHHAARVKRRGI